MPLSSPDFRTSWLWQHAFVLPRSDSSREEQEFFRDEYLYMRERASLLVAQIRSDMPWITVHDVTHLDALWETASLISEGAVSVTPPEAFALGSAILLHDSAMSVAAYGGGIEEIEGTIQWKDAAARWREIKKEKTETLDESAEAMRKAILPEVLRRVHAEKAAAMAEQGWLTKGGEKEHLIRDPDVRYFYGQSIGDIAHSHWWSTSKLEEEFRQDLGAFPQRTRHVVDRIKIACLLRLADALHIDQRRAPRFLRALLRPEGVSSEHWAFQEKLSSPHLEGDAVVFTSGQAFERTEAEAWWLAYDTLASVDQELRDVDLLLQARGREVFRARRVKGIGSPEAFAMSVRPRNWRPVDARIKASDVPKIVAALGGSKLYGDDPVIPLRELIQNGTDAIRARRKLEKRDDTWGEIQVFTVSRDGGEWLVVQDNGVGMSERIMTGPLVDFGNSFWRSSLALEEFPGLAAAGMTAIGRFGIGFFSVFMLGDTVRIISRRSDYGLDGARVMEIRGGPAGRPIIWPASKDEAPLDGGTRVEILLSSDPRADRGLLSPGLLNKVPLRLERLVAAVAPSVEVRLSAGEDLARATVVTANDWMALPGEELVLRLNPSSESVKPYKRSGSLLRTLVDSDNAVLGRCAINLTDKYSRNESGWVTVSGLRSSRLLNLVGVLKGEVLTAARDVSVPVVTADVLSAWASEQASLIGRLNVDDAIKARAAEIVLECGGLVKGLPIVQKAGDWLSEDEFAELVSEKSEIFVSFDGEFSYDESTDDMHPREFRDDFELNENIIIVPDENGAVIRSRGVNWPAMLFPGRSQGRRLVARVHELVSAVWESYDESPKVMVVGSAAGSDVYRNVTVLTRWD